ncbi:DUF3307 domain-containing protein [Phyllobacterium chamaecytisi]|uniref:DUF3307 domain-containing protein n=1 Tax=Phyllobacterium chamaecytisi TaxID=2876082 RepID=UPI001CCC71C9|nr:DUF3307 domain-containing protein [Phyllobacterium sp. KW56]MBZ9600750.1 DUF3307 domain-containing protein [Phyllobacterium sp. KW56]
MALMLFAAHALADYPLQGDWLSKAKNHKLSLVPGETIWPMALAGHAAIHALLMLLVTGSVIIAFAELVCHTVIDYAKCDGRLTYNQDQLLHVACKAVWLVLIVSGLV